MKAEFWEVDAGNNLFLAVGQMMGLTSQVHAQLCGTIQLQIGPVCISLDDAGAQVLANTLARAVEAVRLDQMCKAGEASA